MWLGLHVTHFGFLADALGIVGQGMQVSLSLSSERPAPDGLVCVSKISLQHALELRGQHQLVCPCNARRL